jgi:hypothetical protein
MFHFARFSVISKDLSHGFSDAIFLIDFFEKQAAGIGGDITAFKVGCDVQIEQLDRHPFILIQIEYQNPMLNCPIQMGTLAELLRGGRNQGKIPVISGNGDATWP